MTTNIKKIIYPFVGLLIISSCGIGIDKNTQNGASLHSEHILEVNDVNIIPPSLKVDVIPHTINSDYYTELSNNNQYVAILLTSKGRKTALNNIQITNDPQNVFALVNDSQAYKIPACSPTTILSMNETCEIIVKLAKPNANANNNTKLNIVAAGIMYQKHLFKTSGLYFAGSFSQVYSNANESGLEPVSGTGTCGESQDKPCQIVEYDPNTKTVNLIATTNSDVNGIVKDNFGNLYFGGYFKQFSYNGNTISMNGGGATSTFLIAYSITNNSAIDFIKSINSNYSYPDDYIYAMGFNHNDNSLYFAGSFQNVANLNNNTQGYPLIKYSFESKIFTNAIGTNNNANPDQAITLIGFDNKSNLYLSGFYGTIDNWQYNDGYSSRTINKCMLNDGGSFTCLNGTDFSVHSNNTQIPSPPPATSLAFDSNQNMYITGGFNHLYNTDSALDLSDNSYFIAKNNNPIISLANASNWSNAITNLNPDNIIASLYLLNDTQFIMGGLFSQIGNLTSDGNSGTCGSDDNPTKSCMLALYDSSSNNWQNLLTTDGYINAAVNVDAIGAD